LGHLKIMYLKDTKLPTLTGFLPFILIPTGAVAEGLMITPYLGYRVGGDFTDIATGTELELAESESYGLIIGKDNGTPDRVYLQHTTD